MKIQPQVLLITGPAGSGKTTLAQKLAEDTNWVCISEDDYWVKNGWGSGLRNGQQEKTVQAQVMNDLLATIKVGNHVVLEFILYYSVSPNPLTTYQKLLTDKNISFATVALKPCVEEILKRMQQRGRSSDIDRLDQKRQDAKHQVRCLEADYINPGWLIDPTNVPIETLVDECLVRI